MKTKFRNLGLSLLLVALGAGGYALWQNLASFSGSAAGRRVLFYQDSMHPWIKSDQPGKCTICAMDLTPIYEGEHGFDSQGDLVTLSSNSVTVLNVQADVVQRRPVQRTLRVAGILEADSTRKTVIAAPAPGRIDDVLVASAGVDVQAGQVLASFYSPDLTFQTRRYIFRDRITEKTNQAMTMAAASGGSRRHSPNPLGTSKEQPLAARERAEPDPYYNDLLSTITGTVVERNVFDGQYVAEGDRLFTIVDASVLWFRFDVYEHQLPWLEPGQAVEVSVPSIPGRVFPAVIAVIEPTLDERTRTAKVRADVRNPLVGPPGQQRRLLHLGMYADGRLRAETPAVLTVPRGAILFPGGDAYAYVDKGGGAYEMRRVTLGRQGDDHWEVVRGLEEGDRVVTSGNVLIDAQAQFNRSASPSNAEEENLASPDLIAGHHHSMAAASAVELTDSQQQAVAGFLTVADGISTALAADQLEPLRPLVGRLPSVAEALAKEFSDEHPWHEVVASIQASSRWSPPSNLETARQSFLPFSTQVVELAQRLRSHEARFASTKVFFCPMAPKPGLWFQAKGPLRNPYYGAKMLTCGEEVPPLPTVAPMVSTKMPSPPPADAPAVVAAAAPAPASTPAVGVADHEHPADQAAGHPATETMDETQTTPPPPATRRGTAGYQQAAMSLGRRFAEMSSPASSSTPTASPATPAAANPGSATANSQAVDTFVAVANDLSQALAADSIEQYRRHLPRLPDALAALERDYSTHARVSAQVRKLAALTAGTPPQTLDDARKRFLAFSSNAVELAKLLRKEVPNADDFKIYYCSMAPAPGVWLQTKGPLRNPYYGSKMLTCGEEVEP